MAIETVEIVVDTTWQLISASNTEAFDARVSGGEALFFVGAAAPSASSPALSRGALTFAALGASKVWARAGRDTARLSVVRTVDASNPAAFALSSAQLTDETHSSGAVEGTVIKALTDLTDGSAVEILPNDGRYVFARTGAATGEIRRGKAAVTLGIASPLIVIERHPRSVSASRRGFQITASNIGRALVSTNRLQMLASRVQVTSGDLCKGRYITLISPPWTTTNFSMVLAALYANEQPLGNALNFKALILESQGIKYPLTYLGMSAPTIANGDAGWTDPCPCIFPPNTVYRVGLADEQVAGDYRPSNGPTYLPRAIIQTADGRGDAIFSGATSQVANLQNNTTEFATTAPGASIFDNVPIMSVHQALGAPSIAQATAVLTVGDSKDWGDRLTGLPYSVRAEELGGVSIFARAFNTLPKGRIPWASLSVPSTRFPDLTLNPTPVGIAIKGFDKRRALLGQKGWPFDVIVCEMGLNTATNASSAQAIADAKAAHAQLKSMGNKPVVQMLIGPCALSKDEGTNADNGEAYVNSDASRQVRQANISIDALNNYFLGTPTDVDAVLDLRAPITLPGAPGKWAAPAGQRGRLLADVAAGSRDLLTNFPVKLGDAIWIDVGDATNLEFRDVMQITDNGNGTYALRTRQTMSKAHTAKAEGIVNVCGTYTSDGIHDTPQGSDVLKPLIHAADALFRRPAGL